MAKTIPSTELQSNPAHQARAQWVMWAQLQKAKRNALDAFHTKDNGTSDNPVLMSSPRNNGGRVTTSQHLLDTMPTNFI
jgi:hypothetical protein